MKYLAKISYDGSKFYGFERLNNGKGVQNELERVLSLVAKENVRVHGAGRTDRGVHALDQGIHFDLDINIEPSKLKHAMNRQLNNFIAVQSIVKVDDNFHARHDVVEKIYIYKIYKGEKNPLLSDYAYQINRKLDTTKMKNVLELFVGKHNFKNFTSGERESYELTIDSFTLEEDDEYIIFEIKGKSFYRYMVRSIVGAVIDIGLDRRDIKDLKLALDSPHIDNRFFIAPPEGLYLAKVEY